MSGFFLRQPLTGVIHFLQHSTIEYLEKMRSYCRQNEYSIHKLFEEEDEDKIGFVPEFVFLYVIRKKFSGQIDFSMEQVRLISTFLRVPDGNIWYIRLHNLMKSDDRMLDIIQKTSSKVTSSFEATNFGSNSQQLTFRAVNNPASIPQAQGPISSGNLFAQQPFQYGFPPPQQQTKPGVFFGTTSTGAFNCSSPNKGFSSQSGGLFPTPGFPFGPPLSFSSGNPSAPFSRPGGTSNGTNAGTGTHLPGFGTLNAPLSGGGVSFERTSPFSGSGSIFGSQFGGSPRSSGSIFGSPSNSSSGSGAGAPFVSHGVSASNPSTNFANLAPTGHPVFSFGQSNNNLERNSSFNQNQPLAQHIAPASLGIGGPTFTGIYPDGFANSGLGSSTQMVGTSAGSNGPSSVTTGFVAGVNGSGDATKANDGATKAGGSHTNAGDLEVIPKDEPEHES